jgi:hypothetical protein
MPTDTTTVPTEIEQNNVAPDQTKPSFGTVKRRAGRKALVVELTSSEPASLHATVLRRRPGGRSFSRIGDARINVKQGRNVVTVPRRQRGSLRSGSYKLTLQLVDDAGNKSATKTIRFKIG